MESRNWRLCEQHKYHVQRNIGLLPVARYRETVSLTGAVRGIYSCVERQLLLGVKRQLFFGVKRQLLLVDSEHKNESGSQTSCLIRDWIVSGVGSSWTGQNKLICDWPE